MQTQTLHSYRAVLEVAPATDLHQVPQTVVAGLKARSFGDAVALAKEVFAQPIRQVYRQEMGR